MQKYYAIFSDSDGTHINTISRETFLKEIWDIKIRFEVRDKIREINPKCVFLLTT